MIFVDLGNETWVDWRGVVAVEGDGMPGALNPRTRLRLSNGDELSVETGSAEVVKRLEAAEAEHEAAMRVLMMEKKGK